MSAQPLVTCICPTLDTRARFLPRAIACVLAQDHPQIEMVIVRESGPREAEWREGRKITWISCDQGIGAARNAACQEAAGEFICHFDDDDWSAPDRVSHQVAILAASGKALAGYHTVLCRDERKLIVWTEEGQRPASSLWRWTLSNRADAWGLSYCYRRAWWEAHPFPEVREREDGPFLREAWAQGEALCVSGEHRLIAGNHAENGSGRLVGGNDWEEVSDERTRTL